MIVQSFYLMNEVILGVNEVHFHKITMYDF